MFIDNCLVENIAGPSNVGQLNGYGGLGSPINPPFVITSSSSSYSDLCRVGEAAVSSDQKSTSLPSSNQETSLHINE